MSTTEKKKTIDSGSKPVRIILSALPLVVFLIAIIVINRSNEPDVRYIKETVRQGYETTPASYLVEASEAKVWHDSRNILLIVLGFIISVGGTFGYIYYIQTQVIKGSKLVILVFWAIGIACIFGPFYTKYGTSSYTSTISVERYEANKGNLDAMFPEVEAAK